LIFKTLFQILDDLDLRCEDVWIIICIVPGTSDMRDFSVDKFEVRFSGSGAGGRMDAIEVLRVGVR
jgi:hypothetical protein